MDVPLTRRGNLRTAGVRLPRDRLRRGRLLHLLLDRLGVHSRRHRLLKAYPCAKRRPGPHHHPAGARAGALRGGDTQPPYNPSNYKRLRIDPRILPRVQRATVISVVTEFAMKQCLCAPSCSLASCFSLGGVPPHEMSGCSVTFVIAMRLCSLRSMWPTASSR